MEIRDRFIKKWNECKFGVKTRVYTEHSQQLITYILKTETYGNEDRLQNIIDSIDFHSEQVKRDVDRMRTKIKKL